MTLPVLMTFPLFIKTKTFGERLSALFRPSEYTSCIDAGRTIRNYLMFEPATVARSNILRLLNMRLLVDHVTECNTDQFGIGLTIKLPDDKGSLNVHRLSGYGGTIVLVDVSGANVPLEHWL